MRVDVNADLGEGFGPWRLGDDDGLLDVVTSANVACGFHAGDPTTMRRVCVSAAERGVAIGAQVGYRDLVGFGRRKIDISPEDLSADVLYQLGALHACAVAAGTRVRYVKPHGALYNTAIDDDEQAVAIAQAVAGFDGSLALLGMAGSALATAAGQCDLPFVAEAFPDRAYLASGQLVPRALPDAVLTDPAVVADRAVRLARAGEVVTVDGATLAVSASSLCIHGDTPGAVTIARAVRAALTDAGIEVASFSP